MPRAGPYNGRSLIERRTANYWSYGRLGRLNKKWIRSEPITSREKIILRGKTSSYILRTLSNHIVVALWFTSSTVHDEMQRSHTDKGKYANVTLIVRRAAATGAGLR